MYTVKQAAALTGISEYNLRAWERRYGVVQPMRSHGGYRLYSDTDLARLRRMTALMNRGVPASKAAAAVLEQSPSPEMPRVTTSDLVEAAASLRPRHLADQLAEAFATGPFETVIDHWLMPELARLGEAWERGRLTVAHEHFAAGGVMRVLAAHFDRAQPEPDSPLVLVGLPSGQRHEIPVLALSACLRLRGVEVAYLGADVPTDDWSAAAQERLPRGAVLGVHAGAAPAAQSVTNRLAALALPVWVGGSEGDQVGGAVRLPSPIGLAAAELASQLRSGAV